LKTLSSFIGPVSSPPKQPPNGADTIRITDIMASARTTHGQEPPTSGER